MEYPKPTHKKKKKIKKVRVKSIKNKKREAWTYFARFIRSRANGVCFSCGKLVGYEKLQAGHFHGRKSSVLFMDERNVHSQCQTCNCFRGGNLGEYATKLCQKYGANILLDLYPLAYQTKKWTHEELDALIEKYKEKTALLKAIDSAEQLRDELSGVSEYHNGGKEKP